MANAFEEARLKSQGQKKAIQERHGVQGRQPTMRELVTGKYEAVQPETETPAMLEGVEGASYGQEMPIPEESQFVSEMIDGAIPQQQVTGQPIEIPYAREGETMADQASMAQMEQPQPQQVAGINPLDPYQIGLDLRNAYAMKDLGIADEGLALAKANADQALLTENYARKQKEIDDQYLKARQERSQSRRERFNQYAKKMREVQEVDPNRWWNSRTTGQKISAGIAALLSGFGSGTGLKIVRQAISDDIAEQKRLFEEGKLREETIYSKAKELDLDEDATDAFVRASFGKMYENILKGKLQGTNNKVIKARIGKELANNRISLANDMLKLAQATAKQQKEVKPLKLDNEVRKDIFLTQKTLSSLERMKNALKKGDWTRSMLSNEFKRAMDEGTLLLGFKLSGANVAEREAGEIRKMLKGDITQSRDSILKGLNRWSEALGNNLGMAVEYSGATPEQVEILKNRLGIKSQPQSRAKSFKPIN